MFYIFVFYRNLLVIRNPAVDLQGNHSMMVGQFTHLKQAPDAIYWQLKLFHASTSCCYIHILIDRTEFKIYNFNSKVFLYILKT